MNMYGICLLIVKYLIQIPSTCKNEKSVTNMKTWSRVDSGHIALKTAGPRFVKKSREGKLAAHLQLWQHSLYNHHHHRDMNNKFLILIIFILLLRFNSSWSCFSYSLPSPYSLLHSVLSPKF